MRAYIIRRLLLVIPTVFLASIFIFILMRILPGDIIDAMMTQAPDQEMDRLMIMKQLGVDAPLLSQYGRWVGVVPQVDGSISGLFQGDLGISWWKKIPVLELVANKWPVTLELGFLGVLIGQLIALPIGIFSALRQDSWGDYISRSFAILCISVPGFWLGTMVIVYPSIWWGYMPPLSYIPFTEDPLRNLQMFIVPATVMGMALAGVTMRMTRTMMLEVLRQDYIRTAWAKGLRERVVVLRHALKNALIPIVTIVGLQMPIMFGGTVIIESIFSLPGMGRLIIEAVQQRDYPLVSGELFLFTIALVLVNIVIDLTYAYLDPRIHYK